MPSQGFSRPGFDRLHRLLSGYVERGDTAGVVAALYRRGQTYFQALGRLTIGRGASMERDAIIRISSMTKPVTAVAAMILVEECRLRLDDPLDPWLPELAQRRVLARLDAPLYETVPAQRPLTLRDLLTYRLGLGIVMAPPGTYPIQRAMDDLKLAQGPPTPAVPPAPDEWMRRLGTLPLLHQPGERWMYNTGSDVLGVLIARVAGQPLAAFLQERIFAPLGMTDTGFYVPARFATSYCDDPVTGAQLVYDRPQGQWSRPPAFPAGGCGLVSTAGDFMAFARMLLRLGQSTGRARIVSSASVELITTDQLTPAQKAVSGLYPGFFDSHGWGFGVRVTTRRDRLAGSVGGYGWDGGLGISWYNDPSEDLVGILLTQRSWRSPVPPPICQDFWTTAYQALAD